MSEPIAPDTEALLLASLERLERLFGHVMDRLEQLERQQETVTTRIAGLAVSVTRISRDAAAASQALSAELDDLTGRVNSVHDRALRALTDQASRSAGTTKGDQPA